MINDTYVTVIGNVVGEPRHIVTSSGAHLATFRVASTSRRFDREEGGWRDGDTLYISVSCWRLLADNIAGSIERGQPVIVSGRLRTRSYTNHDGHRRVVTEIDAAAVGHNLSRGVARFQKAARFPATRAQSVEQTDAADHSADPWVAATPAPESTPAGPETFSGLSAVHDRSVSDSAEPDSSGRGPSRQDSSAYPDLAGERREQQPAA